MNSLSWWRRRAVDFLLMGLLYTLALLVYWPVLTVDAQFAFSAPVVPLMGYLISLFGVSYSVAIKAVVFILFCAFPMSVYLFVKRLTGRTLAAVISGFLAVLPTFAAGRVQSAFLLGDGAHMVALTFSPLGAWSLIGFLRRGGFSRAGWASFWLAIVALTSPFGLFVHFIFSVVVTFSEMVLSSGRLKFLRFVVVLILGALMVQFWYTFGYVQLLLTSAPGGELVKTFSNLIPLSLFVAPILGVFGFLLFEKRPGMQPLFVALGLVVIFWLFSFAGNLASGLYISHQSRYQPDLAMAVSFMGGIFGVIAFELMRRYWRDGGRYLTFPPVMAVILIGIWFLILFLGRLRVVGILEESGLVLGIFSENVVGIGQIREQTAWWDKIFGAVISSATISGLIGAERTWGKSKQQAVRCS